MSTSFKKTIIKSFVCVVCVGLISVQTYRQTKSDYFELKQNVKVSVIKLGRELAESDKELDKQVDKDEIAELLRQNGGAISIKSLPHVEGVN